jgi:hypothetical protein
MSRSKCCGYLVDYYMFYYYTLSQHEVSGACCRDILRYTGSTTIPLTADGIRGNYPGIMNKIHNKVTEVMFNSYTNLFFAITIIAM